MQHLTACFIKQNPNEQATPKRVNLGNMYVII